MSSSPEKRTKTTGVPPREAATEPRPIPDHVVQRAIELVETSGVLERIENWRAQDRRGPGGRPETFGIRPLVVAMLISAMGGEPLLATGFTDVLFRRISIQMRRTLGVPDPPHEADVRAWKAAYRNVRTRFHCLLDLMDPSVLPKNRRLSHEQFEAVVELRRAGLSPASMAKRTARLTWFVNALLEMSFRSLPREIRRQWPGSIAVDATVVPAFARHDRRVSRRRKDESPEVITHSSDPDADWYTRGEPDPNSESGPSVRSVWGYELSMAVTGPDVLDEKEMAFPTLAVAMAPLHKPSYDPGGNAIRALSSLHERGHPAGHLAGDRAYTIAKPENFQLPARAMGYQLVLDYKSTQLGIQGEYRGMLLIEGAWYCPCIPDVLINATIDFDAGSIDEATYRTRLAEQWRYQILAKSGSDDGGHVRMRCPASDPSPVARCELKPRSVRSSTRGRVRIPVKSAVAANQPEICTQQSITVPPDQGAKFTQNLRYRSDEWHAVYATLRNCVEGFNGYVKDGGHEALDDPERRRIRGVAAQSVFVALLLVAANLRKIRSFLGEVAAHKAGKLRRLPPRRRSRDLKTWLPVVAAGNAVEPEPPPRTA